MAADKLGHPENLQIDQRDGQLTIIWKWSNSNTIGIVIALVFVGWMVSNVAGFGEVHWTDVPNDVLRKITHDPFPFNLFVPIFLFAGLWALYNISAHTFNHSLIRVSRSTLVIRHGPLPWFGNREIETNTIKQIFTKLSPVRRRHETATLWAPYDLLAIDRTGNTLKLLSNLNLTGEQARAIEQKIEQFLGIKDAPVNDVQIIQSAASIGIATNNPTPTEPLASAEPAKHKTQITRGNALVIVQRWRGERTIGLLIFSLVWITFGGFFSWNWLTRFGAQPLLPIQLDPSLFILGMQFFVGFVLFYLALTALLNRTQLTVSRTHITIQHSPLPWWGNGSFPTQNLKSLNVQKSKFGQGKGEQMVHKLEVHAVFTDGGKAKLIGGFDTQNDALVVQQEIERYLHR